MSTERIIELEHEVVATRRAAVALLRGIVLSCDGVDRTVLSTTLEQRALSAPPAEARLARLLAETLRRD